MVRIYREGFKENDINFKTSQMAFYAALKKLQVFRA